VIYNLLFQTSAATLLEIARDPRHLGAEIGFFARLCWLQAREQELLPARYVHLVFTLPREPLVLSLLGGGLALMVAYAGVGDAGADDDWAAAWCAGGFSQGTISSRNSTR
jgi:hypothetical protein